MLTSSFHNGSMAAWSGHQPGETVLLLPYERSAVLQHMQMVYCFKLAQYAFVQAFTAAHGMSILLLSSASLQQNGQACIKSAGVHRSCCTDCQCFKQLAASVHTACRWGVSSSIWER